MKRYIAAFTVAFGIMGLTGTTAVAQETASNVGTETTVTEQQTSHRSKPVIRLSVSRLTCNTDNLRGSITVSDRSKVVITDAYEDEVLDRGTFRRAGTYSFSLPEVDYGDSGAWTIYVKTYFRNGGSAWRELYVERERPSWRTCHGHNHHNGDHDWDDEDDWDDDHSNNSGITARNG